jgi:alanine racemase
VLGKQNMQIEPVWSENLLQIGSGKWLQYASRRPVTNLFLDSRKYFSGDGSVFFAVEGIAHDGHDFIADLYSRGIRQFVVESTVDATEMPEANILQVKSAITCLQKLATFRRVQFTKPVIGITGSNGKTIIKEWLYQVLEKDYSIAKSPGSYNSQIGVPLSVWNLNNWHTLGIFEAGISRTGEMENLREVIRPDIGIFTNLLSAHDEGFASREIKALEKAKLFSHSKCVICCADDQVIMHALNAVPVFTWSLQGSGDVNIKRDESGIRVCHRTDEFHIPTTFSDPASIENLCHVVTLMIQLNYTSGEIIRRVTELNKLPMRLEMNNGINGCQVIDDSYSNDFSSLKIALDFLKAQISGPKVLILSDLVQTGLPEQEWINEVSNIISGCDLEAVHAIGPALSAHHQLLHRNARAYKSAESFLVESDWMHWQNRGVLIKGARKFKLEQIAERLRRHVHGTVMEIDLVALNRNLNAFKSRLAPSTKLMVMVKAFAYGSGAVEIASFLEHNGVDYLGVAYADEGVTLRNHGIRLPILVMNSTPESYGLLVSHNLEPAVYSIRQLNDLINKLRGERLRIHIKLDTGMHRLGFEEQDMDQLLELLKQNPQLEVVSTYSHLAASDEPDHDTFTELQAKKFLDFSKRIEATIGYSVVKHLLNTAGIVRFPQFHFEMVRLGIGLYGQGNHPGLEPVVTLKTVISQIKNIDPSETVGYGRHGKITRGTRLATLAIGYADGYSRAFGRGKGKVLINGKLAPTIGNICMDMTMVDVTEVEASEGDEVIIFGKDLSAETVASWIGTISYELLTATGERVRRIFHTAG